MSGNLPAIVQSVGGALLQIVSDIEAYTTEEHPLTINGQRSLAQLVGQRPELNTEPRVALLVDALAHHGVDQMKEFNELLDEYDIDLVYLALDYLFEVGVRDQITAAEKKAAKRKIERDLALQDPFASEVSIKRQAEIEISDLTQHNSMLTVRSVIELIVRLRDDGMPIEGIQSLGSVIYRLGGLEAALDSSSESLMTAISPVGSKHIVNEDDDGEDPFDVEDND
jgi:hypothetical protein